MVLVDTTVWIDLLRNRASVPVARLRRFLARGDAAVAPVILQEVLQGAEDEGAFARLSRHFLVLPMVGADDPVSIHVAAARLYARARWQGVTPRSPHDCLIAAIAVASHVPLLHDDRDFERLAAVEPKLALVARG